MPASQTLIKQSRWRSRVSVILRESLDVMVSPWSVADLYPTREVKSGDDWIETREILPHQEKIHAGVSLCGKKADFILVNGGVGSGKSVALHVEMLRLVKQYPGIKIVTVCGYDYYFDESVWPTMRQVLDPDDSTLVKDFNIKERKITFRNESEWRFKAYDDPEKIKGWEAHVVWIEEASQLGEGNAQKARAIYNALLMRLRGQGNYPRRIYISQNPMGHNWVWQLFVKDSPQRDAPVVTWVKEPGEDASYPMGIFYKEYEIQRPNGDIMYTISIPSIANTKVPQGWIERMLDQYSSDPLTRQRMVEGDFNPINVLIYDIPFYHTSWALVPLRSVLEYWELDRAIDPMEALRRWPLYIGIDTGGQSSPWAIEFYVKTPAGELLGIDELYLTKKTWGEVADKIIAIASEWTGPVEYWIDPISSRQAGGPNQQTIYNEFAYYGIPCSTPEHYNLRGGINHVQSLLRPDRSRPHPYLRDEFNEETGEYDLGASTLYYLYDPSRATMRDPTVQGSVDNPKGIFCYFNVKEKEVWRVESKSQHQPKESEEGLSPKMPEKPVDRDDHAQTAEMFCTMGVYPPTQKRTRSGRFTEPDIRYAATRKRVW